MTHAPAQAQAHAPTHARAHAPTHAHIHAHTPTHARTSTPASACACKCTCTHTLTNPHMYIYTWMGACMCMRVYTFVCMNTITALSTNIVFKAREIKYCKAGRYKKANLQMLDHSCAKNTEIYLTFSCFVYFVYFSLSLSWVNLTSS